MGGACGTYGDRTSGYKVVVGRSDGKKPFERTRRKREDNIKTGLQEVGWGNIDWIHLAVDRDRWWVLANAVMNLRGP